MYTDEEEHQSYVVENIVAEWPVEGHVILLEGLIPKDMSFPFVDHKHDEVF